MLLPVAGAAELELHGGHLLRLHRHHDHRLRLAGAADLQRQVLHRGVLDHRHRADRHDPHELRTPAGLHPEGTPAAGVEGCRHAGGHGRCRRPHDGERGVARADDGGRGAGCVGRRLRPARETADRRGAACTAPEGGVGAGVGHGCARRHRVVHPRAGGLRRDRVPHAGRGGPCDLAVAPGARTAARRVFPLALSALPARHRHLGRRLGLCLLRRRRLGAAQLDLVRLRDADHHRVRRLRPAHARRTRDGVSVRHPGHGAGRGRARVDLADVRVPEVLVAAEDVPEGARVAEDACGARHGGHGCGAAVQQAVDAGGAPAEGGVAAAGGGGRGGGGGRRRRGRRRRGAPPPAQPQRVASEQPDRRAHVRRDRRHRHHRHRRLVAAGPEPQRRVPRRGRRRRRRRR
eukprot:Rhum_TRINITY_DN14559_c13_g3::Rhum_TRINITY_DN14559_c13_g3_i1::g.98645::m.98645